MAAMKHLRSQYDALGSIKDNNARWLSAVGRYYGGAGAVDKDGNASTSTIDGVSNPEVTKYSGNIIYVDNRPAITRSSNQKEDIKVILQF